MRLGVALALASACSLLAGCGAQRAQAAASTTPVASAGGAASAGPSTPAAADCTPAAQALSRWREMTWPEYYMDVESRAWRRGAVVIWIEPPRVSKAPRSQSDALCAR